MNDIVNRPDTGTVRCQDCGQTHVAEFSHLSQWGDHVRVFAVVCGEFVEYYTEDVVSFERSAR